MSTPTETRPEPGTAGGLRTEFPFTLPRGYVDERGVLHTGGAMRLATGKDELTAHSDPQVRSNPAYLSVHLISRTLVRLGSVTPVDRFVVEHLFASDLAFLQDLYRRINQHGHTEADVRCPSCGNEFVVDVTGEQVQPR